MIHLNLEALPRSPIGFPKLPRPLFYCPRANGAKRRSGRKPGARVTNSARLFTPG